MNKRFKGKQKIKLKEIQRNSATNLGGENFFKKMTNAQAKEIHAKLKYIKINNSCSINRLQKIKDKPQIGRRYL